MAPRPYWKGHLKLSLVSCPIALYPAVDNSERVSFRQVNRSTGNRLRHQLVDSVTGEAVEAFDKARGYEVAEEQFVVVEDEELEEARAQARSESSGSVVASPAPLREEPSKGERGKRETLKAVEAPPFVSAPRPRIHNPRIIEIEHFIPRGQIDARYHNTPYYIAPRELTGQEAFAVIRDAIAAKDVVGLGRIVLSNRERPIIVEPSGSGLRGITLRYAHEIRSETEFFAEIPELVLPEEMLEVAEHIVETKTTDFDLAFLEDRYRTALVSMLREKKVQIPPRADPAVPERQNVINLMEILQRSLAAERPSPRPQKDKQSRRVTAAASRVSSAKRTKVRGRSPLK
jgi:DNA end-binding protein Ku